ncbi:ribonuclease III [Verrucomicrobiota bacterium]
MVIRIKNPNKELEKAVGYSFRKRKLLEAALTHRSYRFETKNVTGDNQRLEFLGDAALGFVTAAYVFSEFKKEQEGFLTALRSQVTSGVALAKVARHIDLGKYIKMGKGEEQSGGRKRASNLADALEAIVGAAYMDGGIKAVEKMFKKMFVPYMKTLSRDVWAGNPKGKLQEYCQRKWKKSPCYRMIKKEGPAHDSLFTVEVVLGDGVKERGEGRNKREAEMRAAKNALNRLA